MALFVIDSHKRGLSVDLKHFYRGTSDFLVVSSLNPVSGSAKMNLQWDITNVTYDTLGGAAIGRECVR